MDGNLAHLQAMVQEQILQANEFRQKMERKFAELKSGPDERNLAGPASSFSQPKLPSISLPAIEPFHSSSLTSLNSIDTMNNMDTSKEVRFSVESTGSIGSHNSFPLKLTIPKPKKKPTVSSIISNGTSFSNSTIEKKRVHTGKIKKVNTHTFRPTEDDINSKSPSLISPQLVEDIGEAFKAIHNKRLKPIPSRQGQAVRPQTVQLPHYNPLPQVYESRIRTPPELTAEDNPYRASQALADVFVNELNGMD